MVLLDRGSLGLHPAERSGPAARVLSHLGSGADLDHRGPGGDARALITTVDEAAIKAEVVEAADRFRRERLPAMWAGARRVEPYVREVYERATAMAVPVAEEPRRPPPGFRRTGALTARWDDGENKR